MRREVAFDEDLECVAHDLRIFIAERADALLQLGERVEIIVEATPYQQSRAGMFRGHFCMCNCRELGVSINLCRTGGPSVVIPLRLEWTAGLLTQGTTVGFTLP